MIPYTWMANRKSECVGVRRDELKKLSWNVNGSTSEEECVNSIIYNGIVLWTNQTSDIDISGYVSYNFYRNYQTRNEKRCSGGVALYFKQHLQDGIDVVRTPHSDTIVWLKLDKHLF